MRFPDTELLGLAATLVRLVPGKLHRDGSRYLPVVGLRLVNGLEIDIVDRHHRVDPASVGAVGTAQVVFLLSSVRLQSVGQHNTSLEPEGLALGAATRWLAQGQIVALPTWEQHRKLDIDSSYVEAHLDIGVGRIGVRTTLTAPDLQHTLGAERLQIGDWLVVERSRIDILAFIPDLP